jgi:Tfp pilus assembly protein PilN
MIRVNLLDAPKPKTRRPSPVVPTVAPGDAHSPKMKLLVVLVIAAAANLVYWRRIDAEKLTLARQLEQVEQRSRSLAEVKPRYQERQKQTENCKRRLAVIEQLQSRRSGPAALLSALADTVNRTDAVWLSSVKDADKSVDIEAMALHPDAVANLMTNLQKQGYFQRVAFRESVQDESLKEGRGFLFSLTCERGPG